MKKFCCTFVTFMMFLFFAAPAFGGGLYLGLKGAGAMLSKNNSENAYGGGILFGYDFVQGKYGAVSMEAEVIVCPIEGEFKDGRKWDVRTGAGFLTYRTPGPVYLKAKAGGGGTQLSTESSFLFSGSYKKATLAYGIGGGVKLGKGWRTEIEYSNFGKIAWSGGTLSYLGLNFIYAPDVSKKP